MLRDMTRLNEILLDAMPCVAMLLRPSSREIVASNRAAREVCAVPGEQCFATWGQSDKPCPWCMAPELWSTGKEQHEVFDGLGITWDAHWIPVSDDLYIHYAFDITEKKLAEDRIKSSLREKEILLQEVHHRVKNNMAVISSLVNLSLKSIENPDIKDRFRNLSNQIKSMTLVHEKLYRSENLSDIDFALYIKDLISMLSQTYEVNYKKLKIINETESVSITIKTAIPGGLILNELITNSIKYAFIGEKNGEIRVKLSTGENDLIVLEVSDSGTGFAELKDTNSFDSLGLKLVNALVKQLNGNIDFKSGKTGTSYKISFKNT